MVPKKGNTTLEELGYGEVLLPSQERRLMKVGIEGETGYDIYGELYSILKAPPTVRPPVEEDNIVVGLTGASTRDLNVNIGLGIVAAFLTNVPLVGNIFKALGVMFESAEKVQVTYKDVRKDLIEPLELNKYVQGYEITPYVSATVKEEIERGKGCVVCEVLKSGEFSVLGYSQDGAEVKLNPALLEGISPEDPLFSFHVSDYKYFNYKNPVRLPVAAQGLELKLSDAGLFQTGEVMPVTISG